MAPHYGAPRADGRPFPAHSPGLPFLLAPVYALGGRRACVLVLAAVAAWLAVEVHRAALRLTGDPEAAVLAWAAAAGPPAAFYAFHVYTEVPSALAIALSLRLLSRRGDTRVGAAVAAALAAGALPWLHLKMVPAAAALGLVALVDLRGRARGVFVAVALAMAGLYVAYYGWIFGTPSPLAIYGGLPAGRRADRPCVRSPACCSTARSASCRTRRCSCWRLAGLAALVRRRAFAELLVGASVLAPVVGWRMWWGGQCPPARFLVPLVPLLALAVAARATAGRGLARWRWALPALGLAVLLVTAWRPRAAVPAQPGRPADAAVGGRSQPRWRWGDYLPSLVSRDPADARVAVVWVIALAALLGLDAVARRRDGVDRLFRSFGLPVVLLLAIGIATDVWARNERKESHRGTEPQRTEKNEGPAIE